MGFFWCCCECECRPFGTLYGSEEGEPTCQGRAVVSPFPCETTFDYTKVLWQIVKTDEDPDVVVLEGDYVDYLDREVAEGGVLFYMEIGTYELRVWYETSGYGGSAPCVGLPTELEPFTRSITNTGDCCPNSCPIDVSATSSSVTLSGWTNEVFEIPKAFSGLDCSFEPASKERHEFNNMTIFNHTNTTNETQEADSENPGCIKSSPDPKIVLLGDFDTSYQRFYLTASGYDGTPATATFRAWGYFGTLISKLGGGIETEADGTPKVQEQLAGPGGHTYRVVVQCLTDVRGLQYNPDLSTEATWAPFISPGPNLAGTYFPAETAANRPCNSNYAAYDGIFTNAQAHDWWMPPAEVYDVAGCHADWYLYNKDPFLTKSLTNPRATWTVF